MMPSAAVPILVVPVADTLTTPPMLSLLAPPFRTGTAASVRVRPLATVRSWTALKKVIVGLMVRFWVAEPMLIPTCRMVSALFERVTGPDGVLNRIPLISRLSSRLMERLAVALESNVTVSPVPGSAPSAQLVVVPQLALVAPVQVLAAWAVPAHREALMNREAEAVRIDRNLYFMALAGFRDGNGAEPHGFGSANRLKRSPGSPEASSNPIGVSGSRWSQLPPQTHGFPLSGRRSGTRFAG